MTAGAELLPVANGALHYVRAGSGPAIVFLHGFSFDLRLWERQAAALAASFTTVRYDLRGFGRSTVPSGPYDHAEDLRALVDALGLRTPIIVGLSLGANVGLAFAHRWPAALSGLVLVSPGLPGHPWTTERPPDAARAFAQANGVADGKAFWLSHPLFASLEDAPAARALTRAMVEDYSGWHWSHDDPQRQFPPEPEAIAVPTLIASGDRDGDGYREIARILAERIPNARLRTFPDAGHMLPLEAPEAFEEALRGFVATAAPTPTEENAT